MISGLRVTTGSGGDCFAAEVCVNRRVPSCSCKRAACCFNSSVVGFTAGMVASALVVCSVADLVSILAEALTAGGTTGGTAGTGMGVGWMETGGLAATVGAGTPGATGMVGVGCGGAIDVA